MTSTRAFPPRPTALRAVLCACAILSGCSQEPPLPPPDQTYTLRGKIETLPQKGKPMSELTIHHEPLPAFRDINGNVVGMTAMVMPFTPTKTIDLTPFSPGDIVEFTFEVRWKSLPYSRLTRMTKLPSDTQLNFKSAD